LEKASGVITKAKWRRLERLDFSSAMERTALALGVDVEYRSDV
jgi:hypothetical protein